jgi:acyl-CoA dehydrogenase
VISAIVKYHLTERGRQVINEAMDVHGGKGICMGPNNYLASAYMQTPIAITVEGANILTRTMIIFGQGAIRGHPFVLKEIEATREKDPQKALRDFDRAFFGHIAFTLSNVARVLWMGMTGSRLTAVPGGAPELKRYYQQLTRLSSGFALTADMAMFLCGGTLKRRERLSARLGDVLSQLYLASAVLKRYEDDGRPQADLPLVRWGLLDCLYRIEEAFYSIFENLPWPIVSWLLRGLIFPLLMPYGREFAPPRDPLGHAVVGLMMTPGPTRDRLTRGVFISDNENDPVRTLESALTAVIAAEPVEAKLRQAQQAGRIARGHAAAEAGLKAGVITPAEADLLKRAAELRRKVIMVDDFPKDFGKSELHQTTQPVTFEALTRK